MTLSFAEDARMDETSVNQRVAEQIRKSPRSNGQSFRLGDCVALLDGKVVGVANDLEGALRALRAIDPNPLRGMIFRVAPSVPDVIR
jgi:hypothetical protein